MADLQKYKPLLPDNPLCGIGSYKDTLNLATGACTRWIEEMVLTGEEDWRLSTTDSNRTVCSIAKFMGNVVGYSSHILWKSNYSSSDYNRIVYGNGVLYISIENTVLSEQTAAAFKSYLTSQYVAGTPFTVWCVKTTPQKTTIPVPTGLTGTTEGYLNQDGTPTLTNPIYPTVNNVEIWLHSLRKLTTSTDTITTLPADIYADGNNATVGISGNTVQNGTPTPDNPIMPHGTGERTGNLFDAATAYGGMYNDGVVSGTNYAIRSIRNYFNDSQVGKQITISIRADKVTATRIFISTKISNATYNSNSIYAGNTGVMQITVTPQSTSEYWFISYGSNSNDECILSNIMLNEGSTALPYEPYGYKIPILSASTTTPVYLGEVETTRKIKKLVLTGEELWTKSENGIYSYFSVSIEGSSTVTKALVCSHFVSAAVTKKSPAVGCMLTFPPSSTLRIRTDDIENVTLNDFTSYLAAQYANGTPVTVWYVLGEPETGIANEPLMKISDYADTVSGITIPTITSKDTFDVDTTLKPSEVSLSYTGWHDATVKEWDSSQWS